MTVDRKKSTASDMKYSGVECKCVESEYIVKDDGNFLTDIYGMPQRAINRSACDFHKQAYGAKFRMRKEVK